jgi:hypothetical protein
MKEELLMIMSNQIQPMHLLHVYQEEQRYLYDPQLPIWQMLVMVRQDPLVQATQVFPVIGTTRGRHVQKNVVGRNELEMQMANIP